ncbi:tetratricopeptide repeat protein [Methanohalobium evestigatum]|uniref:tetratricopeptide repeat protein n=1 Tax=Methanohalobium evestigatum TaxID=2322 RepID=UPI0012F6A8A1|nr:tetratricopeptide repeat protein [Methanohalobium evestigatum]
MPDKSVPFAEKLEDIENALEMENLDDDLKQRLLYFKIELYKSANDFQTANQIENSLSMSFDDEATWYYRAFIASLMGNHVTSLEYLNNIVKNNDEMKYWLLKAANLDFIGHYKEAVECCNKALKLKNDPGIQIKKGELLKKQGLFKKARIAYGKALENDNYKHDIELLKDYSHAYQMEGKVNEALKVIKRAKNLNLFDKETLHMQADMLAESGHRKEAVEVINMILEINPDDFEAAFMKLELLLIMKRYKEAENLVSYIFNSNPDTGDQWLYKAKILSTYGYYTEADEAINEAEKLNPVLANISLIKANHYSNLGEYDKAIDICSRALEVDEDVNTYSSRSEAYAKKGDLKNALRDINNAINLNDDVINFWNQRGEILWALGDLRGALESFRKALKIDDNDSTALKHGSKLLHNLGDHSEAVNLMDKYLSNYPEDVEILGLKGSSKAKTGNCEEGLKWVNKALKLKENYPDAWDIKSAIYTEMGKHEASLDAAEYGLFYDPENPELMYKKGCTLINLQRYEEAFDCINQALGKKEDVDMLVNKARLESLLGKIEDAVKTYNRAIELEPRYEALNAKVACLITLERFEEAMDIIDQVDPNYLNRFEFWMNKIMCFIKLNRYDEALECIDNFGNNVPDEIKEYMFQTLSETLDTDNVDQEDEPKLMLLKGAILFEFGKDGAVEVFYSVAEKWMDSNPKDALESLNRTLSINPDDVDALRMKADLHYNLSDYKKSLKTIDKALEIEGDNARLWLMRSYVLDSLGKTSDALESLEKAHNLSPDDNDVLNYKIIVEAKIGQ